MFTLHALSTYALLLAPLALVGLALMAIGYVSARREHASSDAERAALDGLIALAATCARSAALALHAHPGPLDAALAERIVVQVVLDLRVLGSQTLTRLRALQRLDRDAAEQLLTAIAREQVARLREARSELAPSALGPLRGGTIRLGLAVAPPPHGSRAGEPPADPSSPAR